MRSLLLPVCLLFSLLLRAGDPGDTAGTAKLTQELLRLQDLEKGLKYQTGTIALKDGIATVKVPKGFRFLGADDARKVVEDAWGNLKGQTPLGLIVPGEDASSIFADYAFIVEFDPMGYVKDDDADKINYDDLLKDMKADGAKENEERRKQGLDAMELVGWANKPYYDKNSRILYWAKEFKVAGSEENTLNYDVRVLGRRGVLILKAVSGMSQLDSVNTHIKDILGMVSFNEGHRYTDFDSKTDEVAAWTIGGLVAGKVLAKVGFFAFLLKYIKLIVLAVVAFFGGIWRRIRGKKKDDGMEAQESLPAPEPEPVPADEQAG